MIELPAQALLAVSTILAAIIAGLFAFINLTLSKEQKTSEFRQSWIDALRDDLSIYLSGLRMIARSEEIFYSHGSNYSSTNFPASSTQVQDRRTIVQESLYRIKLRLNSMKPDHSELERLLDSVRNKVDAINKDSPDSDPTVAAIENATKQARIVLKIEWERVKKGELAFRAARNWILPIILAISSGFIIFLLSTNFRT